MLMVGLWHILIKNPPELYPHLIETCKEIFARAYMDNVSIASQTTEEICEIYDQLAEIFNPYGFGLQQFVTNDKLLQTKITDHEAVNSVLGLNWDTVTDSLRVKKIILNPDAKTKREVLATVMSIYDPIGIGLPLLNRARIFLHDLQCRPDLEWDAELPTAEQAEWKKITKQYNKSPEAAVQRYVATRTTDIL